MLEKFLNYVKQDYAIAFKIASFSNPVTVITVERFGRKIEHAINLDAAQDIGLDKDVAIMAVIDKLAARLRAGEGEPVEEKV